MAHRFLSSLSMYIYNIKLAKPMANQYKKLVKEEGTGWKIGGRITPVSLSYITSKKKTKQGGKES